MKGCATLGDNHQLVTQRKFSAVSNINHGRLLIVPLQYLIHLNEWTLYLLFYQVANTKLLYFSLASSIAVGLAAIVYIIVDKTSRFSYCINEVLLFIWILQVNAYREKNNR